MERKQLCSRGLKRSQLPCQAHNAEQGYVSSWSSDDSGDLSAQEQQDVRDRVPPHGEMW